MMNRAGHLTPNSNRSRSNLNQSNVSSILHQTYVAGSYSLDQLEAFELEYEEHEHLQAGLKAIIAKNKLEKENAKCIDQLSSFTDKLTEVNVEEAKLKEQIAVLEYEKQLSIKIQCLKSFVNETKDLFSDELMSQLDSLVKLLNTASHKLYLKNIVPITEQSQFDTLEAMILNCANQINLLIHKHMKYAGINDLKNIIVQTQKKQEEIQNYSKRLTNANEAIWKVEMKVISDAFAELYH